MEIKILLHGFAVQFRKTFLLPVKELNNHLSTTWKGLISKWAILLKGMCWNVELAYFISSLYRISLSINGPNFIVLCVRRRCFCCWLVRIVNCELLVLFFWLYGFRLDCNRSYLCRPLSIPNLIYWDRCQTNRNNSINLTFHFEKTYLILINFFGLVIKLI